MSKFFVVSTVSISGLAVLGCLATLLFMLNDLNNFYDEAISDLKEFRSYADIAWSSMNPQPETAVEAIFRGKRAARRTSRGAGQCNCGAQPNNCPAGPAGPPGKPGEAGKDGDNGQAGTPGTAGKDHVSEDPYANNKPCVVCPAGPPGPAGPDGPAGPAGPDGKPGADGEPGNDVEPGAAGPQGDNGPDGDAGPDGKPGPRGRNGKRGHGKPGPRGPVGPAGPAGKPGSDGEDGGPGMDGGPGGPGANGKDGQPGKDGDAGAPGAAGEAGSDAAYCPCPKRAAKVEAQSYDEPAAAPSAPAYEAPAPAASGYDSPAETTSAPASSYRRRHRKIARKAAKVAKVA